VTETTLPTVSAIVVTFRSGPALKECLYALLADGDVSEIIVVNNGTTDADLDWLRNFKTPDRCRYELVSGHGNIGFAAGVNLGARHAMGERLLIINPDAVLRIGSVRKLEEALSASTSHPCLVGGKLIYPSGDEQRGARRELLTPWRAFVTFTGLYTLESMYPNFRNLHREHDEEPESPVPMPVISGALCYISTTDYTAISGFDEGYFLHVEDIDICRRVAEAGGKVIYTPLASAMHYGSTSKVSVSFVEWNKAKGLARYFRINSKGLIGRTFARASLLFFAPLLIGRSLAIRGVQHTRQAIRELGD
tara:strand:- start:16795 stop:17715 length:921 start_codon:yes stop_codon:yes gene_type:complete